MQNQEFTPSKELEKNKQKNAIFILLVLPIYIILLGILGIKYGEKPKSAIIVITIGVIFLLIIIIGLIISILKNKEKKIPKIFQLIEKIYLKLLRLTEKLGPKEAKPFNKEQVIFRLIYLFVFLIIPTLIAYNLTMGQYSQDIINSGSGFMFNLGNNTNTRIDDKEIIINLKLAVNSSLREKFTYFVGDVIKIKFLDLCFTNNGTKYDGEVPYKDFKSTIFLDDTSLDLPLMSRKCITIDTTKEKIPVLWKNKIELSTPIDRNTILVHPNWAKNEVKINLNDNIIILTGIIILAWIGICHLIYHVIKDFREL